MSTPTSMHCGSRVKSRCPKRSRSGKVCSRLAAPRSSPTPTPARCTRSRTAPSSFRASPPSRARSHHRPQHGAAASDRRRDPALERHRPQHGAAIPRAGSIDRVRLRTAYGDCDPQEGVRHDGDRPVDGRRHPYRLPGDRPCGQSRHRLCLCAGGVESEASSRQRRPSQSPARERSFRFRAACFKVGAFIPATAARAAGAQGGSDATQLARPVHGTVALLERPRRGAGFRRCGQDRRPHRSLRARRQTPTGAGSVAAAQMAVEDFGGTVPGKPIAVSPPTTRSSPISPPASPGNGTTATRST